MEWKAFEQLIAGTVPDRLSAVLDEVNGDLLKSLLMGEPYGRADVFPLCRLVTFMGLVKSPSRERQTNDEEKPIPVSWKEVYTDINRFVDNVCPPPLGRVARPLLFNNFDDRKIKAFASLGHPQKGQTDRNFYVTVLLYLYYQWCLGNFESKLFRSLVPRSDRNSPVRAIQSLASSLRHDVAFAGEPDTKSVSIPFSVLEENDHKFRTYFDEFSLPKRPQAESDGIVSDLTSPRVWQLQFIVYRPMATDAAMIMRSFLSIYFREAPIGFASDLNFTHWVQPPSHGQKAKIATGKLVSLNKAFYLIGGQRSEGRSKNKPYDTAKIMALDSLCIEKSNPLVTMVALSSRNDGRPIMTRAVARVTPFDYSREVDFTPIRLGELEAALVVECRKERAYIDSHQFLDAQDKERILKKYPLPLFAPPESMKSSTDAESTRALQQVRNVARQILSKCSNAPDPHTGIAVPPGYSSTERALTKSELNAAIEHSLMRYKDREEDSFDLWSDTLFGPLTLGL